MNGDGKHEGIFPLEAMMRITEKYFTKRLSNSGDEQGMALISVMLIMSLMLMLAMAVTFTSLSDKAITSNFKNLTSGFYAAEAGVNNLHRLLRNERFVMASLPNPPQVNPGRATLN